MTDRAPSTHALLRLAPLDGLFTAMIPVLFGYTLSLKSPRHAALLLLALGLLRTALWMTVLRSGLAPVDRFARSHARSRTDAGLHEAGLALRGAFDRFLAVYGVGWLVQLGTGVVWVVVTNGGIDGMAPRFLVPGFLVCVTIVLGSGVFAYTQSGPLIAELGFDIFREADARGVSITPPTSSIRTRVAMLAIAIALTPLGWLGAIGLRSADVAAANEAGLRARAAALATLADGTAAPPADVLAWAAAEGRTEATRLDASRGRVHAFVRRPDGRVGYGSALVDSSASNALLVTLIGFFFVVCVWAPITAFAFGRDLGEGVGRVTKGVGRLLEVGDLRSMQSLPILVDDEIGELTRHFNELVAMLSVLAAGAERVAQGDLGGAIEGRGELPDAFRGMLDGLRAVVGQIRRTAVDLASAAAEIYSASQEQEAAATQQSTGITEVSRTMESLAGSAAHISESVGNVLGDAERTRLTTEQMAARIAELNAHAGRIGELLEVIREVADRSDLLALNGSLEATRAGDSGRGFSLVAGEMRRLAERVMATVEDVRSLVSDVRASGSATVMATDQSRKLAESTTEAARRITLVTQQQRTATEQVTASVREVADVLAQAAAATTQTRVSAENLKQQADQLETILARFRMEQKAA